jgi:3-deoxy-D-arabino-heptulosonate 7-phosphate (DAHP) synthase
MGIDRAEAKKLVAKKMKLKRITEAQAKREVASEIHVPVSFLDFTVTSHDLAACDTSSNSTSQTAQVSYPDHSPVSYDSGTSSCDTGSY